MAHTLLKHGKMLAKLSAAAVVGIDAVPVTVEVDVSGGGLPGVTVVGLPDATIRESRDRVRSAIRNAGFPTPRTRVIVSLTPSDLRKMGTAFDLPIALGMLIASGVIPYHEAPSMLVVGGLALDGRVLPMRGLLPVAAEARRRGVPLMCPADNLAEAAIVQDLPLLPVSSLVEAVRALLSPAPRLAPGTATTASPPPTSEDLSDVRGQHLGRRALEIAAAGGHHLLLTGPPGAGKTMLARRLPGLLPPLDFDEALAVTTVHSVAGTLPTSGGLITTPPFRAPHHTASDIALVGGGSVPRPGERLHVAAVRKDEGRGRLSGPLFAACEREHERGE
jgi:magnesium chelatase family protein